MQTWRLLKLETHDAFMNMAIDESIMKSRIERRVDNTVRFYRWRPSAVSIGRYQQAEKETHIETCRRQGIDIVRRMTGGGAVYHDSDDEITYSVVARKEDLSTVDIAEVYRRICSGISEALAALGIRADFNEGDAKACPNLKVNGRKISGSSQAYRGDVVLQHGTVLTRVNLERMFTFLRIPWAQTCMQVARIAQNKITSIETEIKRNCSTEETIEALTEGFEKGLNARLETGELTVKEIELAGDLYRTKYGTEDWNLNGHS